MDSWCSPCATRSHLIDEHMGCMGAAAPLVTRIAGADAETLAEMHNVAHAQRRADGREDHEHAANVWQPNPNYTL